ncbi:alpha/beta hydrolase [Haematobacter missouriensis]|uniref:Alpha/beta hydrolase n=1 Tax=Haematobacter missouriensis TaxID=366616 RepID=A0A212AYM4_9RHOB|nr:alpha/beta hydrolase [Haematobacter missouriensis]KFI33073.1 alpha/beta hydrolase [Haematobacter missouriensis]OWJ79818.1 alpha/beta hydrolase [Haematobacter missouriensis]OWJ86570.1 alpha/beta hydrolase [Haematobacter missouriensis]
MASGSLLIALVAGGSFTLLTRHRAKRNTLRAEAEYPAVGAPLILDGIRVEAVTRGHGPDLVLIHGASGNHRDFSALLPRLVDAFRVTLFDRPSLGWTDEIDRETDPAAQAEFLSAAADKLGIRNPILVGHSYGGAVALAWAMQRPGRVRAVVAISAATHPYPRPVALTTRLLATAFAGRLSAPFFTAWSTPRMMRAAFGPAFAPQVAPGDYAQTAGLALTLRPASFTANARQVAALSRALRRLRQGYPGLTLPVEVLHGDADAIVPVRRNGEALAIDVPSAVLSVIPNGGHMLHHTHPDAVIAAIQRARLRSGDVPRPLPSER